MCIPCILYPHLVSLFPADFFSAIVVFTRKNAELGNNSNVAINRI